MLGSRLRALLLLPAIAAIGPIGCGDDDAAPPELVDTEVEVLSIDNVFDPETIEVEAGTTVVFRNVGRNDHNVVPDDETADWGVATEDFGPTAVYSHRFSEPGEYRYFCSIHGTADVGMIGVVTVAPPGG